MRAMSEQTTTTFRTVMRGYDPSEVDRQMAELSRAVAEANARADELEQRIQTLTQAEEDRQLAKPQPPPEPTFHDFGKRIGRILAMAEEEAEEMRAAAVAEVERSLAEAEASANETRAAADRYAQETRESAEQEAARI